MADLLVHTPQYAAWPTEPNRTRLDIEESIIQMDRPLDVAMAAPGPVFIDRVTGNFKPATAAAAGAAAQPYGIGVKPGGVGETITAIKLGVLSGLDLTPVGYGAELYLSDVAGNINTVAGTVPVRLGECLPAAGPPMGQSPAKLLQVDIRAL